MSETRRWILGVTTAVTAAGLVLAPLPAHAQAPPDAGAAAGTGVGADKKVTLNLKDTPLRTAIDLLFAGSGLQYAVEPNVPNVPITLMIRDVTLQQALRLLVRLAAVQVPGLTSQRDGDIFIVRIRPQTTEPTKTEETVTAPP